MKFQSEAITLFRQRKFRKITRRNGKENNALSTEMENTKIIICEKQVMHMLKCQEAEEKLIAFCHKHSQINMITFAYFILLLICCLGDSCDTCAPVSKRKSNFHYCSNMKQVFWLSLGISMPLVRLMTQYSRHMSAGRCRIIVDQEKRKWLSYVFTWTRGLITKTFSAM